MRLNGICEYIPYEIHVGDYRPYTLRVFICNGIDTSHEVNSMTEYGYCIYQDSAYFFYKINNFI